eukprot:CAMPEP_0194512298 /NCGR_PEP_ID=MMETSP0253-20130528/44237_1 /TAXON_ID=2966 /ORGANISM="Noctiluca scintillans" /LENGTH=224 /DNA_ID=CAMNT_0039355719 /DNA_START=34 /DNA_END=708 /DNA_ORIENTATION=-
MYLILLCFMQADAFSREVYTTNAICQAHHCINPVFPALNVLDEMDRQVWIQSANVSKNAPFCGPFLKYSVALPVNTTPAAQDNLASKAYFYHLSAMGLEPWDHLNPSEERGFQQAPCIKQVAKMVCYTHFPVGDWRMPEGNAVAYRRPCAHSCQAYVDACGVRCCDESVQCVFNYQPLDGVGLLEKGYTEKTDSEVEMCTGSLAAPSAVTAPLLVLCLVVFMFV